MACRDGRVIIVDNDEDGWGIHVVIDHNDGWKTTYAHLNSTVCLVGDTLRRGQLVGFAGNTGNSFGVHLHLTVQHMGHGVEWPRLWPPDAVDPQDYL